MNRRERRALIAMGRKDVAAGRLTWADYIGPVCDVFYDQPLTEEERALAAEVVAWRLARLPVWHHGGVSGLAAGDVLLPAAETGADPRGEGDMFLWRRDFVYITPCFETACDYARKARGFVYRVRPLGDVGVDPTALRRWRLAVEAGAAPNSFDVVNEFTCPGAEVVG